MVNKEVFLKKFRLLFDSTDPSTIQLETVFKDIEEWGSLTVLSLIVMAEEECQMMLTPSKIEEAGTVSDLFDAAVKG